MLVDHLNALREEALQVVAVVLQLVDSVANHLTRMFEASFLRHILGSIPSAESASGHRGGLLAHYVG